MPDHYLWTAFQPFDLRSGFWELFFVLLSRVEKKTLLILIDCSNKKQDSTRLLYSYDIIIIWFFIGWISGTHLTTRGRNIRKSRTSFWTIYKNGRKIEAFLKFPSSNWHCSRTVVISTWKPRNDAWTFITECEAQSRNFLATEIPASTTYNTLWKLCTH